MNEAFIVYSMKKTGQNLQSFSERERDISLINCRRPSSKYRAECKKTIEHTRTERKKELEMKAKELDYPVHFFAQLPSHYQVLMWVYLSTAFWRYIENLYSSFGATSHICMYTLRSLFNSRSYLIGIFHSDQRLTRTKCYGIFQTPQRGCVMQNLAVFMEKISKTNF